MLQDENTDTSNTNFYAKYISQWHRHHCHFLTKS